MEQIERNYVQSVRDAYAPRTENKIEKLRRLDARAHLPAQIFSLLFGVIGALVLGTGMCLAMKIIGDLMPLGIVIGVVGIAMVSANYFLYKALLRRGKRKYAEAVISLSNELLNE